MKFISLCKDFSLHRYTQKKDFSVLKSHLWEKEVDFEMDFSRIFTVVFVNGYVIQLYNEPDVK